MCAERAPQVGLLVHDALQFPPPLRTEAVRRFGFTGRPVVEAVVPGGPADRAGIRTGDAIVAVSGRAVPEIAAPEPDRRGMSYARIAALQTQLSTAFADGPATLSLLRDGAPRTVRIDPVEACGYTVQLQPGRKRNAWSDGRGVALTSALLAETASDDELAVVIAHELAHNVLRHRDRLRADGVGRGLLSRVGSKAAKVRRTEEEADHVGLYLVARADYDPAAGAAFWRRHGEAHGDGILADGTHPGWRGRVESLTATATEIAAKRADGRELLPDRRDR